MSELLPSGIIFSFRHKNHIFNTLFLTAQFFYMQNDPKCRKLQCTVCARQAAAFVHIINLFLNILDNYSQSEMCCGRALFHKVGVCCMWWYIYFL
jgi:hypothetical protein